MEITANVEAEALLSTIAAHTCEGTTIIRTGHSADVAAGDLRVAAQNSDQSTRQFVVGIPATDEIKDYWKRVKLAVENMRPGKTKEQRTKAQNAKTTVEEIMWRERFGRDEKGRSDGNKAFEYIMKSIADLYLF